MARLWAVAFLTLAAAAASITQAGGGKDKEMAFQVKGKLTSDDPADAMRAGPTQTHVVPLKAGKTYIIDMVSTEMDSYLRLLDPDGKQLAEDDDSGGNLNARIVFNCTQSGDYRIVTTTVGASNGGKYLLTVKNTGGYQAPSTAHSQMIGNAAPDLKGDFAVNGKPVKISDLKGNVVLLDFCEVRSNPCVLLLPRLGQWHKAYKADGLVIVGVTFYLSDIGQDLGFDKATGKLIPIEKADRKTDKALLRAFAKHHNVKHLLMTLPKQEALDAFDAYTVGNVPQLVLIDRKGIVRLIDVRGEKNSANVESEIKKLLAEK